VPVAYPAAGDEDTGERLGGEAAQRVDRLAVYEQASAGDHPRVTHEQTVTSPLDVPARTAEHEGRPLDEDLTATLGRLRPEPGARGTLRRPEGTAPATVVRHASGHSRPSSCYDASEIAPG